MHKETEDVRAVVDRDGHDPMPGHILAVIARLRSIAVLEAATEDVYQYRELLAIRFRRRPDVQVEAILAHTVAAEPVVRVRSGSLHTAWPELVGVADATPVLGRLRLAPAK